MQGAVKSVGLGVNLRVPGSPTACCVCVCVTLNRSLRLAEGCHPHLCEGTHFRGFSKSQMRFKSLAQYLAHGRRSVNIKNLSLLLF